MSKTKVKYVSGQCSCCGSSNVDYGAMEIEDNMVYYPITCTDPACKATGKEWYIIEYFETIMEESK